MTHLCRKAGTDLHFFLPQCDTGNDLHPDSLVRLWISLILCLKSCMILGTADQSVNIGSDFIWELDTLSGDVSGAPVVHCQFQGVIGGSKCPENE